MKNKETLMLEVGERHIKVCRVELFKKKRIVSRLEAFEFPQEITAENIEESFSEIFKKCPEKVIISFKYFNYYFSL